MAQRGQTFKRRVDAAGAVVRHAQRNQRRENEHGTDVLEPIVIQVDLLQRAKPSQRIDNSVDVIQQVGS